MGIIFSLFGLDNKKISDFILNIDPKLNLHKKLQQQPPHLPGLIIVLIDQGKTFHAVLCFPWSIN
jgi:hypothetical protein